MIKNFTLALFAALCSMSASAAVTSVDDLTGEYTPTGSGFEAVTDWSTWTELSSKSYSVSISKKDDNTVTISNLTGFGESLTGSVDLTAKTITIAPTSGISGWATLSGTASSTTDVVGTFDDDCNITFSDLAFYYGSYTYSSEMAISLKKSTVAVDWTATGTITYYNKSDEAQHSGTATLKHYTGSDTFEYGLALEGASASPSEIRFKVEDGLPVITNTQYASYKGGYYYYPYDDIYYMWVEYGEGFSSFTGDKDSGSLKWYQNAYNMKGSQEFEGAMTFTWGTTGINSITSSSADNDAVFDLAGRRISKPSHGLYIMNGKKIIVK